VHSDKFVINLQSVFAVLLQLFDRFDRLFISAHTNTNFNTNTKLRASYCAAIFTFNPFMGCIISGIVTLQVTTNTKLQEIQSFVKVVTPSRAYDGGNASPEGLQSQDLLQWAVGLQQQQRRRSLFVLNAEFAYYA